MPNAVEEFLRSLKRTINGVPYPAQEACKYAPISYHVAGLRDPLQNTLLSGKYRIDSRLGKGAMAVVYKAIQEPIDRVVALKVLNHNFSKDPVAVKRFNLEAKILSSLKHRNILSVHDLGNTENNQPFFVMEYLDGLSLESLIEKRGPVPIARAVPVFSQICDAMGYAHAQGVIHRDLKPANVMLVREENGDELVKLVDFGIVQVSRESQMLSQKLTLKGEVWGSPVYMSPEQCRGSELDSRSDVYSMGLLMYESLLGVLAFDGPNIGVIASKQISEMPLSFKEAAPLLRIPETLEAIVLRALQKNPADRFQSMDELNHDLQAFAKNLGIKLRVSSKIKTGGQSISSPTQSRHTPGDKSEEKSAEAPAKEKARTSGADTTGRSALTPKTCTEQRPESEQRTESERRRESEIRPESEEILIEQGLAEKSSKGQRPPTEVPSYVYLLALILIASVLALVTLSLKSAETTPKPKSVPAKTQSNQNEGNAPAGRGPEPVPEKRSETVLQKSPEEVPKTKPESLPQKNPETVPQKNPETISSERNRTRVPEKSSSKTSNHQNTKPQAKKTILKNRPSESMNDDELERLYLKKKHNDGIKQLMRLDETGED